LLLCVICRTLALEAMVQTCGQHGGIAMKDLPCVLLGHRWMPHRVEGETRVECRRCGFIADASAEWGRIYGGTGPGLRM
jgi:hypothetical protein